MATIAQGMITLSSVNDAYSVSLSPSSCVINADYNGKNPKLTYAYSDIRVIRGETAVPFDKPKFLGATNNSDGDIIQIDETTWRVQFTSIPETDLSGSVQFEIKVGTDFQTVVTFAYTVVRETSMLDWILDWNGTYTEISGKWIITPKIFAGIKNADNEITGVYLGPAFDNNGSTGLYGYKDNEIIFQLTETGGTIGGWNIENGGIQTSDGVLKILSEGSIISAPDGVTAWELNKSGSATFAKGNVKFNVDGSAEFAGRITSSSGLIGGWIMSLNQIRSNHIILDSDKHLIGINADIFQRIDPTTGDISFPDSPEKAIKLWYNSENDWGLAGWNASNKVFQLGSSNFIAGWNFDNVALWTGVKNNTARQNTASEGDITIGSAGLRGMNWYIDHDGEISFVNGLIHFDKNGGTISGWTLNPKRLNTKHAALISNESFCGLYLTLGDLSESADGSISQVVHSNGGIEIVATQYNAYIWAHESDGTASFYLSSLPEDVNWIGGWCFDGDAIFFGDKKLQEGQYTSLSCITISPRGLRGAAWRLEADGSGAVAKGNITWDKNGNVAFANSVKMAWSQITGTDDVMTTATYIDANGIFTGKINANNITTGTLSSERINTDELLSNGEKWALLINGSGYLASKNIEWDADGNINVKGAFSQDIHYAYKCDATVVSRTPNNDLEDFVELKLNHQLYIATNVYDIVDEPDFNDYTYKWPFELDYLHYYTIRLPLDPTFIGKEVKIYDCNYGPFSRQPRRWCTTTIKVENDVTFSTKVSYEASFSRENLWKSITIRGGYASFVCIPTTLNTSGCTWICVDFYGALCEGVDAKDELHQNLNNA